MPSLPAPLLPLAAYQQFVCWFAVPDDAHPGKFKKFPADWRTGAVIDAHNPAYWTDADTAAACAQAWDRGHGCGAGFVLTEADPFFFLDIDACAEPEGWSELAGSLCERLRGAAVEVSHSGRGLHVLGRASPMSHASRNLAHGLELYTDKRFVALTGSSAIGDASRDVTGPLLAVVLEYFPPSLAVTGPMEWTEGPVAGFTGPADDTELLRMASSPAAAAVALLKGKWTFADLWAGRVAEHQRSEADGSLASSLAFWTGKDCARTERLMRQSGLCRPKWDERRRDRTWIQYTILRAAGLSTEVAEDLKGELPSPGLAQAAPVEAVSEPQPLRSTGREYLTPTDQRAFFEGCYFVTDQAMVYSLRHNKLLTPSTFDVLFGGYLFTMDPQGSKHVDSAYQAFTKSRVNVCRIVDGLSFRPEFPTGQTVTDGNRVTVNSYVPYECEATEGDASKWEEFLRRILPIAHDRAILCNYMASIAQNPGFKSQWWPVIQGVEGNGKSILIQVMTYIHGDQYTHLPNAHSMARDGLKFNGWIERKLFLGIEEIMLSKKREFLEELKVVVTNSRIPLERKGAEQINVDNRANGMLCTNHRDGVPIDVDSRRYAIFYTAQQFSDDLQRDGLAGGYFPDLYDWLYGRGVYAGQPRGFAVVARWLQAFELDAALDPARGAHRAPQTSASHQAVLASLGRAEQEILEATEEERIGFAGGFVSSYWLNRLLFSINAAIPHSKRRDVMHKLGYDWHPMSERGRCTGIVAPEGVKSVLYIKFDNPAMHMDIVEAQRLYSAAQEPRPTATVIPFRRPQ